MSPILRAVRSPGQGRRVVASGSERGTSRGEAIPKLTAREQDVLELVSEGLTTHQMSEALGISRKTVENHKQNLFQKLGVQNQAHAVALAMRVGLLTPGARRRLADA